MPQTVANPAVSLPPAGFSHPVGRRRLMARRVRRLLADRHLVADCRRASELYGVSVSSIAARALRLAGRGFEPREALAWGLLDTRLPWPSLSGCISKHRLYGIQRRLNPRALMCRTEDKSVFSTYCTQLGLPVPRLYAVFDRVGWLADGAAVERAQQWVSVFERDLPDEFVVKPAWGAYGRSIRVLRRCSGGFDAGGGAPLSAPDLYRELTNDAAYRKFVIQERLHNHPDLTALSGAEHLQTLRIVTYGTGGRDVRAYAARLKVIASRVVVDNFHRGQSGNIEALVRRDDGVVEKAVGAASGAPFLLPIRAHPATGTVFAGFRMPYWNEALELALRAAGCFLPMRTIGWDIAVTPRGPVLVEGNMWWDPFNYVDASTPVGGDYGVEHLVRRLEQDAMLTRES